MPELAGRIYVPTLYKIQRTRAPVVQLLEDAVEASGGRVLFNSFRHQLVAPIYIGAEDGSGARYGLLVYPFTATRRVTGGRGEDEHRAQVRLGDPVKHRDEANPLARDVAGVDLTLVLTVDPELRVIVGLDPLVYQDLPMGISVYYRDADVDALRAGDGWAVWEREKTKGARRARLAELETMVGLQPHRLLDYVRFEARASALGLSPALRGSLAREFGTSPSGTHQLEEFFSLGSKDILDIVQANFRLGVAVRGGVAQHHLENVLKADPGVVSVVPIDADGQPDFIVGTSDGRELLVECKTASSETYRDGTFKVETQKTRDSRAGRKYTFEQFDVVAACLFSATGFWEYRFRWTRDLAPWPEDTTRIKPVQRIDESWATSLGGLLGPA